LKENEMTNFPENRDNIVDVENMIREADVREESQRQIGEGRSKPFMYDYVPEQEEPTCEDEDDYDGQPDEYTEWQDYMGGDEYYDHSENGMW